MCVIGRGGSNKVSKSMSEFYIFKIIFRKINEELCFFINFNHRSKLIAMQRKETNSSLDASLSRTYLCLADKKVMFFCLLSVCIFFDQLGSHNIVSQQKITKIEFISLL